MLAQPSTLFELYQFEQCPYCVRVRAHLTDLGLTYIIHNVSRDKSLRVELAALTGGVKGVPTLIDPNTNTTIADDDDAIIKYLDATYA